MVEEFRDAHMEVPPNYMEGAIRERRAIERMLKKMWTIEPAIVTGYDPVKQRVDVKMMNESRNQMTIPNIPIYNTTGDFRIYRSFKTTNDPTSEEGDIGLLLFPRTDSTGSFNDRKLNNLGSKQYHRGLGAVFLPGPLTGSEDPPTIQDDTAGPSDLDKLGPNDSAIVHQKSGSFILFKENGEVVIKAKAIYFGDTEDNVTSFKEVARKGDQVTAGETGQIDQGSANVFAGD